MYTLSHVVSLRDAADLRISILSSMFVRVTTRSLGLFSTFFPTQKFFVVSTTSFRPSLIMVLNFTPSLSALVA